MEILKRADVPQEFTWDPFLRTMTHGLRNMRL